MSASDEEPTATAVPMARMVRLAELPVAQIKRNPNNPRLHFTAREEDRLAESIDEKGILVPVSVSEDGPDSYVLIDGERRWRCAVRLGLETIPAVIVADADEHSTLLNMFNIHMVREQWEDMPTAWALKRVMDDSGVTEARRLEELTGLSVERIRRYQHALNLPEAYQRYIDEGTIPLNFFWELDQNVVQPLAKRRPNLTAEFSESAVLDAFVNKRLSDTLTDTVSLRKVRTIINKAADEAAGAEDRGEDSAASLDETIRSLISDPARTIDEAYQDSVEMLVELDKLERRTANFQAAVNRLLAKTDSVEDKARIAEILNRHCGIISDLVSRYT